MAPKIKFPADLWMKMRLAARDAVAAEKAKLVPMTAVQHENPMDDASPVVKTYHVSGGPCGFAGVRLLPGTSGFARWAVKKGVAHADSYYGGVYFSAGHLWSEPSPLVQSLQLNEAAATAAAEVLRAHGFERAYMSSRMD